MADIAPFRGIRYDTTRVRASDVLAPPYDVIDADHWRQLAARDPHNCVRVILPEGDGDAKYSRAAELLDRWLADGVLVRDDQPCLYRYNQVFTSAELGGREVVRRGFVAAVRLHRFDERVILPHERTLKGPKVDRLKLFEATACHPSQIFTLYSDPQGAVDEALAAVERTDPVVDGTTDDGTRHLVWRVTDRSMIAAVVEALADKPLYIADGHHRYETMLAYRDRRREAGSDVADFGTLFLANMDDAGLVVFPTHRLVHGVPGFSLEKLVAAARDAFDIDTVAGGAADAAKVRAIVTERGAARPAFGVVVPGSADLTVMAYRGDLSSASATERLDVTILHDVVLEGMLGIDRAAQEAKTNLDYPKDTAVALARVAAGDGQCLFVMNPTPVAAVKAVSDEGGFMPQKSTFFYPKIASGVVFRKLDESIAR
ncbi:MAG: DUF1015 domain-containing protein [Deltaproteobacteria bacterium]|nr:MAG: DUF1015 domain-containing protein [Deltaproteobacteria bacterium]